MVLQDAATARVCPVELLQQRLFASVGFVRFHHFALGSESDGTGVRALEEEGGWGGVGCFFHDAAAKQVNSLRGR